MTASWGRTGDRRSRPGPGWLRRACRAWVGDGHDTATCRRPAHRRAEGPAMPPSDAAASSQSGRAGTRRARSFHGRRIASRARARAASGSATTLSRTSGSRTNVTQAVGQERPEARLGPEGGRGKAAHGPRDRQTMNDPLNAATVEGGRQIGQRRQTCPSVPSNPGTAGRRRRSATVGRQRRDLPEDPEVLGRGDVIRQHVRRPGRPARRRRRSTGRPRRARPAGATGPGSAPPGRRPGPPAQRPVKRGPTIGRRAPRPSRSTTEPRIGPPNACRKSPRPPSDEDEQAVEQDCAGEAAQDEVATTSRTADPQQETAGRRRRPRGWPPRLHSRAIAPAGWSGAARRSRERPGREKSVPRPPRGPPGAGRLPQDEEDNLQAGRNRSGPPAGSRVAGSRAGRVRRAARSRRTGRRRRPPRSPGPRRPGRPRRSPPRLRGWRARSG